MTCGVFVGRASAHGARMWIALATYKSYATYVTYVAYVAYVYTFVRHT